MFGNGDTDGIVQRALQQVMHHAQNTADAFSYHICLSFWEMNESHMTDLLTTNHAKQQLRLRRRGKMGFFVESLTETPVSQYQDVHELLEQGRMQCAKLGEARGSRWNMFVKATILKQDLQHPEISICSSLLFANIKGAERVGKSGAKGQLLKQGVQLNKTAACLSNAIHSLVKHVNQKQDNANGSNTLYSYFGDSKVTQLLSDCFLDGYATTIIGALPIAEYHYLETMDTLENLRIARHVKIQLKHGKVTNELGTLYKRISDLKSKLPQDTLANGHPATEQQEELQQCIDKYNMMVTGYVCFFVELLGHHLVKQIL